MTKSSKPFEENTYTLLANFLAPNKSPNLLSALKTAITENKIDWGPLLYQANLQMCSPLWYARLRQDDLLQYLPEELQKYLQALYEANAERNEELKQGLEELLKEFNKAGIETVLLKGATTFVDNLYDAAGARYMGDLDILAHPDKVDHCQEILVQKSYQAIDNPGMALTGLATDERHHQLPRYHLPGSPVVVEIHFKTSYGQVGRLLPTEQTWAQAYPAVFRGQKTKVPSVQDRVLLNTAHALIPHREFIKGSIDLYQLAEFAALVDRHVSEIDWKDWWQQAQANHLATAFSTYLRLAHCLLETTRPSSIPDLPDTTRHENRVLSTCGNLSKGPAGKISPNRKLLERIFYYRHLPGWMWNNVCYAAGITSVPARLITCWKKLLSANAWKNI